MRTGEQRHTPGYGMDEDGDSYFFRQGPIPQPPPFYLG